MQIVFENQILLGMPSSLDRDQDGCLVWLVISGLGHIILSANEKSHHIHKVGKN